MFVGLLGMLGACQDDELDGCDSSEECPTSFTCLNGACIDDAVLGGPSPSGGGGVPEGTVDRADVVDASDAADASDAPADGSGSPDARPGTDVTDGGVDAGGVLTSCADLTIAPDPVFVTANLSDVDVTTRVNLVLRNAGGTAVTVVDVDAPVGNGFELGEAFAASLPRVLASGGAVQVTLFAEEATMSDAVLTIVTDVCAVSVDLVVQ